MPRVQNPRRSVAAFPLLAREWHPTKNLPLRPADIPHGSTRRVWWRCPRDRRHVYQATPNHRTKPRQPEGCPFCAGKRVDGTNSLARRRPKLAREWHPNKNGALTPADVVPGSDRAVWWQCPLHASHVWRASVVHRARDGTGCPFCAGKRACVTNSLAALYPALAAEWHPTNNGALAPDGVTARSKRRVWWKCVGGPDHEWASPVERRTKARDRGWPGCPFCSGYALSVTNRLSIRFPAIAAEWHPTKNHGVEPSDVVFGTPKLYWWRCRESPEHEWRARPDARTRLGTGCPFCARQRVTPDRSLAVRRPDLAALWHPKKNGKLTPADVAVQSSAVVWWRCRRGPDHEWQQTVKARSMTKRGCPFCLNTRVSVTNSLATRFPKVARDWHWQRNGEVTPADVVAGARLFVWWRCPLGHAYRMSIAVRTVLGRGCPVCAEQLGRALRGRQ